jgi:hypothetical protein
MYNISQELIALLVACNTVYGMAVPQEQASIEARGGPDPNLSEFMKCATALKGWPNADTDEVKKCVDSAHSSSKLVSQHKREFTIEARYTPGDYAKCIEINKQDSKKAAECEKLLPTEAEAAKSKKGNRDTSLNPRQVLNGQLGEILQSLCPVDASKIINWSRFLSAETLKGWAPKLCAEAMGVETVGNTKTIKDKKHGLRKIGITFARGPTVTLILTIVDFGLDFFKVKDTGVKYCVDTINAGLDYCVHPAKAGLEHANIIPSFTSYVTPGTGDPTAGGAIGKRDIVNYLAVVDVSFPAES